MIRTLHHAADAPAVLHGIADILGPNGAFVLEFANKQNIKAILRYWLRKQSWSPFDLDPVEFVDLNFDFHPRWMWSNLENVGLHREATRTVSHFRIGALKRWIPTQPSGGHGQPCSTHRPVWQLSPSVFTRARASQDKTPAAPNTFFRCPVCSAPLGMPGDSTFHCSCGATWQKEGEIYNFRDQV